MWTQILEFAQSTTQRVGLQLLKDFGQVQATEKADGSLVTQADRWADAELREAIAQVFPSHGVLSEEAEHILPDNDWCWVIDPLDGTTNFARGLPIWGISLGLLHRGSPVFGYVHLPPLEQSFYGYWAGESGLEMPSGAFVSDRFSSRPIHTSSDTLTHNHFFNLCARSISLLHQSFPCKIRMLGAATYNILTVAMGATLGGVEATPKIWDIAAVWPIVQAAGGVWIALEPEPIFPLQVGRNYGQRSFPTLVVGRTDLLSVFEPLARSLK